MVAIVDWLRLWWPSWVYRKLNHNHLLVHLLACGDHQGRTKGSTTTTYLSWTHNFATVGLLTAQPQLFIHLRPILWLVFANFGSVAAQPQLFIPLKPNLLPVFVPVGSLVAKAQLFFHLKPIFRLAFATHCSLVAKPQPIYSIMVPCFLEQQFWAIWGLDSYLAPIVK